MGQDVHKQSIIKSGEIYTSVLCKGWCGEVGVLNNPASLDHVGEGGGGKRDRRVISHVVYIHAVDSSPPSLKCFSSFHRRCYGTLKTQCGKSSVEALKSVQLSLEDLQFLSTRCVMENAVEGQMVDFRRIH